MSCRRWRIANSASDFERVRVVGAAGGLQLGDLLRHRFVERGREGVVLGQLAHRRPHVGLLGLDRRVVLAQLVLTGFQRLDDRVEVRLRGLVLREIALDLVAARQPLEHLLRAGQVGAVRVEFADRHAQVGEGGRDPGLRVRAAAALARLHDRGRPVEHPVGDRGGGAQVLVAHGRDRLDLLGELRRARVDPGQLVREGRGLLLQLGLLRVVDRDGAGGLLLLDDRDGCRRREHQLGARGRRRGRGRGLGRRRAEVELGHQVSLLVVRRSRKYRLISPTASRSRAAARGRSGRTSRRRAPSSTSRRPSATPSP